MFYLKFVITNLRLERTVNVYSVPNSPAEKLILVYINFPLTYVKYAEVINLGISFSFRSLKAEVVWKQVGDHF